MRVLGRPGVKLHGTIKPRFEGEPPSWATMPLPLTDRQMNLVMTAAGRVDPDKRSVLLERVAAHLRYRSSRVTDDSLAAALQQALTSLSVGPAA
jgi:hypothetical protein